MAKTKPKKKTTTPRGGRRSNAGRKSYFQGMGRQLAPPWLTEQAHSKIEDNIERLNNARPEGSIRIARNVFLDLLIRRYAGSVQFSDLARLADGEWRSDADASKTTS